MSDSISLVDRGRGLQLSTSRVTVMDLVPYFRSDCSADEIRRWIPSLSAEEIGEVEAYYRTHKRELDEADDRERAYREEQIRQQHLRFPPLSGTSEERLKQLRNRLHAGRAERNGEGTPR